MPSFFHSLASASLILSFTKYVLAFNEITIQETVQAGTNVEVTITTDFDAGPDYSFDAEFTKYNVYLSVSPPNWGSNPVCLLINGSDIHTTSVTVQIPASVGPNASNYSIVTAEYNTNIYSNGPSGFEYSNDFTLTGGTGAWSEYETDPRGPMSLGDEDCIPCSAYDCARQCNQKYYPANFDQSNTGLYEEAYEATYKCVAACPGVAYPSWDSMVAPWTDSGDVGYGDDDDDEDDSDDYDDDDDDDDEYDDGYSAASSTITGAAASSTDFVLSTSSATASQPPSTTSATSSASMTTSLSTSSTASTSVTPQSTSAAVSRASFSTSMFSLVVILTAGWVAAAGVI